MDGSSQNHPTSLTWRLPIGFKVLGLGYFGVHIGGPPISIYGHYTFLRCYLGFRVMGFRVMGICLGFRGLEL